MANFNQYFLLVDHIKLSLLERQRAILSKTNSAAQDHYIAQSLESLREGIAKTDVEQLRLKKLGDLDASQSVREMGKNLQAQYDDFMIQFRDNAVESTTSMAASHMNDIIKQDNVSEIPELSRIRLSTTPLKTSIRGSPDSSNAVKTVHFSDSPLQADANFFPYRDEPSSVENSRLNNQQLLSYHSRVIEQQDQALDHLSKSIQRQRELSIQIGGELNEQVDMLDGIDQNVDRHQTRLRQTMKQLETTAKNAKNNKQLKIIAILLIILVVLIVVLNY